MVVLFYTNPASVDTSQDTCGGEDNDKKMLFIENIDDRCHPLMHHRTF
jgi:hypothetical protein